MNEHVCDGSLSLVAFHRQEWEHRLSKSRFLRLPVENAEENTLEKNSTKADSVGIVKHFFFVSSLHTD